MDNRQGPAQPVFMGLSREQVAKILYEELSKSGFQFNNLNTMIPPILGRMFMENGNFTGNYLTEMFFKGIMGNFNKK